MLRAYLAILLGFVALPALSGCAATKEATEVVVAGNRELRERDDDEPRRSPNKPAVLVIAIDGVNRDLLYDMLEKGELPEFAKLLGGGKDASLAHAYLDRSFESTLPSSTIPAWVTALTGVGPAYHGVTGNEFFIREERRFAAPVPVTFSDPTPVFRCFTDGYANKLSQAPSVYQRLRKQDPHVQIWVAMQHYHAGADRLLLTDKAVFVRAFEAFFQQQIEKRLTGKESREVYKALDASVFSSVTDELEDEDEPLPDVLHVYVSGTDQYAHVADEGPDKSRREYLREVLDEQLGDLSAALQKRGALENRYVLVLSDHGHTEVPHDDNHSLAMDEEGEPPALITKAGYRLRPFKEEVDEDNDFQAVLAYQGAIAYVYLADRSTCAAKEKPCDWKKPPRFEEDVVPLAEAFYENNRTGALVPELKGTLDMVLARKPKPYAEDDLPFEVYVGGGKLQPLGEYLKQNPHPDYLDMEARLKDLAAGPHGERAGDVLLLANNGNRHSPKQRYYFASWYHSWHGSPAKSDTEIPLIVAHPGKTREELQKVVKEVLRDEPRQQRFTDLLLRLRLGPEWQAGERNAQHPR